MLTNILIEIILLLVQRSVVKCMIENPLAEPVTEEEGQRLWKKLLVKRTRFSGLKYSIYSSGSQQWIIGLPINYPTNGIPSKGFQLPGRSVGCKSFICLSFEGNCGCLWKLAFSDKALMFISVRLSTVNTRHCQTMTNKKCIWVHWVLLGRVLKICSGIYMGYLGTYG